MHLRIGGGVDINGPKIVLPGIDVYGGKIGCDIKGPGLDSNGPKSGVDVKDLN